MSEKDLGDWVVPDGPDPWEEPLLFQKKLVLAPPYPRWDDHWTRRRFPNEDLDAAQADLIAEQILRNIGWHTILRRLHIPIARTRIAGHLILSCIFHQERTPSLQIWVNGSGRYYCHGCKAEGNIVDFVARYLWSRSWKEVVEFFDHRPDCLGQLFFEFARPET